ncbi:MAG TPA: hypothetical protein VNG33_11390, partial [Polyangiaceae bacterium]|nr:hypothetical protein [Polyangiaceae bacterium]
LARALRAMTATVRSRCDSPAAKASLTVLVTNGETLVAGQGGKELYLSTHKTRCSDRGACKSLSPECEAPTLVGHVNHCIISSEPLQGENVWAPLDPGDIVGVDVGMHLYRSSPERHPLPVVA